MSPRIDCPLVMSLSVRSPVSAPSRRGHAASLRRAGLRLQSTDLLKGQPGVFRYQIE